MFKKLFCLMMALMLLIPSAIAQEDTAALDEQFAAIFKRYKTTGAVLTIAKEGEIIYRLNYGLADKKAEEPVTDETYFRLASVTKMITAIHVMQLVEQGLLDLDRDISDYFGYTIRNPHYKKVPITLRQLMSHTSSISAGGGYANDPDGYVWKMLSLERSRTANYYKQKPGAKYVYSNLGAGLMGSLIEIATGKNFGQSVDEGLFQPLGIDAAYNVNLLEAPEKISNLYSDAGKLKTSRATYLKREWDSGIDPEYHFRSTAGALWMRGEDLCRLGILLCQGGTLEGVTILQPDTVYEMMSSQKGKPGITCDSKYGLCIYRKSEFLKDRIVYGHQGMSEGVVSALFFDPETQLVFSVITNGSDSRLDNYMAIINRKLFALVWECFGDTNVQ